MKKVVLIGYMGSGKSIISKKLSNFTEIPFVELDEMIEKRADMAIKSIFEKKGELYFRKLENELFKQLLEENSNMIISTGGGTPCYFNNHELMNGENIISIYLKASVETLYNRLIYGKQKRPLIAHLSDNEVKEFIAKHLFDRIFYYNQAKYKINVDDKSIEEIVNEISNILA